MNKIYIVLAIVVFSVMPLSAQWVSRDYTDKRLRAVQFFNTGDGYIVGENGLMLKLSNWGKDFEEITNLPFMPEHLSDLCFVNQDYGWVVGAEGAVFKTEDGGQSPWKNHDRGFTTFFACHAFFIDILEFAWVGGADSTVWFTNSGGDIWETSDTGLSGTVYDLFFTEGSEGFCVTSDGIYHQPTGQSWNRIEGVPQTIYRGFSRSSETVGWAVGENGTILRTTSLPGGWQPITTCENINTSLNSVHALSDNEAFVVGNDGLVLHITNAGANCEVDILGNTFFEGVFALDRDNIWIVGNEGANYYSEGTIQIDDSQLPDSVEATTSQDIHFSTEFNSFIDIFSSSNNGENWDTLAMAYPAIDGVYRWEVPDTNSNKFLIRIQSNAGHKKNVQDISKRLVVFTTDAPVIDEPTNDLISEDDQALVIQAKITSKRGFSSIKLFYRKGGEIAYDHTGMILIGEDLYQGVIRNIVDVEFGKRGIEYYIEAIDNSIKKNSSTLPDTNPKQNPNSIQIIVNNEVNDVVPSTPGDDKYQMISIPLDYGDEGGSIRDVLFDDFGGLYDRKVWRLFRWKNGQRIEFPNSLPDSEEWRFEPGRAFWLVGRSDSITTGTARSVMRKQNAISLPQKGWHQVANPFAYNVSVDSINLSTQLNGFYEYLPDSGKYRFPEEVTELIPFKGYFINSDVDSQTLIIPPIEAGASLNKENTNREMLDWKIILNIKFLNESFDRIVFGYSSFANDQYDRLDWLDPPSPTNQNIRSYIPHPDWPTFRGNYKRDIRLVKEEGEVWDFIIESDIEELLKLTFEIDSHLSQDVEVILLPKDINIPHDLKVQPHYQYYSFGKNKFKEFRLIVGPQEYIDERLSQITPTQFTLFQNYPNPFNPTTTIRYALSKTEKVTLKVYNLLGKEVVTLVNDEEKTMGYHVEVWDGRNQDGRHVASGIYIYQILTSNFTITKKMALVR